jgi:hypothetical protein
MDSVFIDNIKCSYNLGANPRSCTKFGAHGGESVYMTQSSKIFIIEFWLKLFIFCGLNTESAVWLATGPIKCFALQNVQRTKMFK